MLPELEPEAPAWLAVLEDDPDTGIAELPLPAACCPHNDCVKQSEMPTHSVRKVLNDFAFAIHPSCPGASRDTRRGTYMGSMQPKTVLHQLRAKLFKVLTSFRIPKYPDLLGSAHALRL